MNSQNLVDFFNKLDRDLADLEISEANQFIDSSFPSYNHIGRFHDPRDSDEREYYYAQLSSNLERYSFDPLISFEMKQIKYSQEVLHPDCNCYRRDKYKLRPIKTCSHRDRILYAGWNYYLSGLHKKWLIQKNIFGSVSAYIPETGKFNAHYAKKAFDYIQNRKEYSVRAIDVRSFFDKIPHKKLKGNLIDLINNGNSLDKVNYRLYRSVTNYTFIELEELKKSLSLFHGGPGMYFSRDNYNWNKVRDLKLVNRNINEGIPQGLACSGVLANISMMEIDIKMTEISAKNDSIYLRYADDIFIASPNKSICDELLKTCSELMDELHLPIADEKTEKYDYRLGDTIHPNIGYLGLKCKGNEISVRMNGVNKFYKKTSQFIFSYVLTCKSRSITPSKKKIRAIFSHSGGQNYYSYLRRASKVFESDSRYKCKSIKGILKNHLSWLDAQFDLALKTKPSTASSKFELETKCTCPLDKDK